MIDWFSAFIGAIWGITLVNFAERYVRPVLHRRRVRRNGLSWHCDQCTFSFQLLPRRGGPTAANVEVLDSVIAAHREVHTA